ncbi:hypothetical protein SCLCIDRAFT_656914 [Scleroderma citrinum Foug A]|uniref:Uncharacterized protein n=1 Tax=Scleroderma citrinum Foug A TaxID=1036808 RepID=A0A0C2ZE89_9AGAM|nr:hypothetical protein SCLCIDRAFT_656914 [Scleroderma citrinum Foug A]
MTPDDDVDVYSSLRIVIPSRSLKRKIQDVDSEDSDYTATLHRSRLQERVVKDRWSRSNTHAHRDSISLSMRV